MLLLKYILFFFVLIKYRSFVMVEYTLTEEDIQFCHKAVEDLDEDGNGEINIYDLETVLERLQMYYEQFELCKLISELDHENKGIITFESILSIYKKKKQADAKDDNDEDTLDAYMAIGGPSDKSGHIDEKVLIKIINQEFQLPIDMQELIKSVDDSCNGQIQYEQFYRMLQDKPHWKLK